MTQLPVVLSRSLRFALCALLVTACASQPKPPPLSAPAWDAIPVGVLDLFCSRLKMDAIAGSAPLAIVATTRPISTAEAISALGRTGRGRTRVQAAAAMIDGNRRLPVTTAGSSCAWRPVEDSQTDRVRDEMLVELSAPLIHPFLPTQAGLFARASLAGEGASWYWISLVPYGQGWRVVSVSVLVQ